MIILRNGNVFDGTSPEVLEGADVVVEDGRIREVSARPVLLPGARVIDLGGRFLMPGLIDAHAHPHLSSLDAASASRMRPTYYAHHAARVLRFALSCGFTTLRDAGGGDAGLAQALDEGLIEGPRLFYAGRALSQTGGHGDLRDPRLVDPPVCACRALGDSLAVVVDGEDAVRRAVREELRLGASHIKIMASGGVFSPGGSVDACQFSMSEIGAVVDEAARAGKYVLAHCHSAAAIRRCVEAGVRSLEHVTLIDDDTARLLVASGAYAVPTMAIMYALEAEGGKLGMLPHVRDKLRAMLPTGLRCLEILKRAGARMGFGCDLIGPLHTWQCRELLIRAQVLTPLEILRSATSINAEIMMRSGEIGCIAAGARADLIVVDGDPLRDIGLLAANGSRLSLIMKGGQLHRNTL